MTWKQLRRRINEMSDEQLRKTVNVEIVTGGDWIGPLVYGVVLDEALTFDTEQRRAAGIEEGDAILKAVN